MSSEPRSQSAIPKRRADGSNRGEVLDPFAIKVSIPPLVLFSYVVWKYYSAEDPRLKSIREAEAKHEEYMADLEEEKRVVQALANSKI